jgi:hypothetical protein
VLLPGIFVSLPGESQATSSLDEGEGYSRSSSRGFQPIHLPLQLFSPDHRLDCRWGSAPHYYKCRPLSQATPTTMTRIQPLSEDCLQWIYLGLPLLIPFP